MRLESSRGAARPLSLVTVPGYTGSGPDHWQSIWERAEPGIARVEQNDWDHPEAEAWSIALDHAVRRAAAPVVLVAHSCGCLAVAHWTARFEAGIAGAFLVAPPDADRDDLDGAIRAFVLPALTALPFPSLVVASNDDPFCDVTRAKALARQWRAGFVSAGSAGHINTASGHGPWPEGRQILDDFCARLHR